MLIGLSVSKCVADIMQQKVNTDDVLVIIGRTNFKLEQIDRLISQYQYYRGEWYDYDRDSLEDLLIRLFDEGKIHQPRQFGAHPRSVPWGKHWLRVMPEPQDLNESAQKAWDRYLLLAGLTK